MKRFHFCLSTSFSLWFALTTYISGHAFGEAIVSSGETTTQSGHKLVTIESDLYRLTFDPERGGRCSSFFIKATKREWVYDGEWSGLFLDHFAHQYWPGELLSAKYDCAIEGNGSDEMILHLWTVPNGEDRLTRGLKVEKRITLKAGHREVRVVNAFTNPTNEGKNVALWVQQCFCFGGDRLFDSYYRPSSTGISLDGMDDKGEHKFPPASDEYAQDWVKQPLEGWSAGRDRRTNEGAVFLMDYNYLNILYNCAGSYTTEWFMDRVPLPSGKSWTTEYLIVPVDGFTGFVHASNRLIANVEVTPDASSVKINHQFAGSLEPLGAVKLKTTLYGIRSKHEESLPPLSVANVGMQPVSASQTWNKPQTEPIVIRVEARGADWTERYEHIYEGSFGGQGIQGSGSVAEYTTPRPKKTKTFLKPDGWTRPRNDHLRVLVMHGLYTQHYRLDEAFKSLDPQCEIKSYDGWDYFPPTYEELLGYDLLVLSDVPAGPDYANEMVSDYVERGGGVLLTLGGMLTYGSGQWSDTTLEPLLPVTISNPFDLKWNRRGIMPKCVGNSPVTVGIEWPKEARFYWIHDATAKPGSAVVLRAGKQPLLVLGVCGKGRVATLLATCHGGPDKGQVAAWETPAWTKLLVQVASWLREGMERL